MRKPDLYAQLMGAKNREIPDVEFTTPSGTHVKLVWTKKRISGMESGSRRMDGYETWKHSRRTITSIYRKEFLERRWLNGKNLHDSAGVQSIRDVCQDCPGMGMDWKTKSV